MAARRLIIVMLVLLGISTALAVITPDPREPETTEEPAGPTGASGATGPDGDDEAGPEPRLVEASVVAGEQGKPITARAGDRVVLDVHPKVPADVEIRQLGLTATAGEAAPAVFDFIMPSGDEEIEVTALGAERPLATVSPTGRRDASRPEKASGRSRSQS